MSNEVMVKVEVEVEIEVEVVIVASHSHGYAKHEVVDDVLTMSHDKKQPQKKNPQLLYTSIKKLFAEIYYKYHKV